MCSQCWRYVAYPHQNPAMCVFTPYGCYGEQHLHCIAKDTTIRRETPDSHCFHNNQSSSKTQCWTPESYCFHNNQRSSKTRKWYLEMGALPFIGIPTLMQWQTEKQSVSQYCTNHWKKSWTRQRQHSKTYTASKKGEGTSSKKQQKMSRAKQSLRAQWQRKLKHKTKQSLRGQQRRKTKQKTKQILGKQRRKNRQEKQHQRKQKRWSSECWQMDLHARCVEKDLVQSSIWTNIHFYTRRKH